jgi:hypothetical protein
MDTFHVTLESPKGHEKIVTGYADSAKAMEADARREYPRHTLVEIENATTGETTKF